MMAAAFFWFFIGIMTYGSPEQWERHWLRNTLILIGGLILTLVVT